MNTSNAKKNLEADALADYLEKAAVIAAKQHKAAELEAKIAKLDDSIEEADRIGLDEVVDTLCKERNDLDLERLEVELQRNKLEKELLEFEKIRHLTR